MTAAALPQAQSRTFPVGRLAVYAVVFAIGVALAFAPFLFPDVRAQEVAARICIFIVLVASYDLLIGYTGIVSFAHTMFFGLGAYGTAIALRAMGPGWDAVLLGGGAGVVAALVLAALIGLLSLPSSTASQPGPIALSAIAVPYAPSPKNIVWANETMPV